MQIEDSPRGCCDGDVLRDYRDYVLTGTLPNVVAGELIPRCRLGASSGPQLDVPPLIL